MQESGCGIADLALCTVAVSDPPARARAQLEPCYCFRARRRARRSGRPRGTDATERRCQLCRFSRLRPKRHRRLSPLRPNWQHWCERYEPSGVRANEEGKTCRAIDGCRKLASLGMDISGQACRHTPAHAMHQSCKMWGYPQQSIVTCLEKSISNRRSLVLQRPRKQAMKPSPPHLKSFYKTSNINP